MNAGLFYGYISLVEGLIDRIITSTGKKMTVIATGGLARDFQSVYFRR